MLDYAWNVYQGDGRAIAAALDPPAELQMPLVVQLIVRGRVEDGIAVWRAVKQPSPADAQKVAEALFFAGRYAQAYDVWNAAALPDRPTPDAGSLLSNGGFERKLALINYNVDRDRAHISIIDHDTCLKCVRQQCINCCPANCYSPQEDGRVVFSYEGCVECGTCRIVCNEFHNVEWTYPRGDRKSVV